MESEYAGAPTPSEVDAAWHEFAADVALRLRGLPEDSSLLVDAGEQDREDGAVPYVFASRRPEGLWVEVSSNHYLSPELAIDEATERRLLELGLRRPDDEHPNYFLPTHLGAARRVGEIFVVVLRDLFGVRHPWDLVGDEFVVPERPLEGELDELEVPPLAPALFPVPKEETSPPVTKSEARRSIDDLVDAARQYRQSSDFRDLLEFVGGFRFQAPFNALLLHIQRPGSSYVLSAQRWRERYGRVVRPGERPLVVLQTFGPVMFVYDVSQTEPVDPALDLPGMVAAPFAMPSTPGAEDAVRLTVENAKLDGVRITAVPAGSQSAGCIRSGASGAQEVQTARRPPRFEQIPVRYDVEHNRDLPPTEVYATLAHELGHLYCGHLGTPNPKWWPDRRAVTQPVREFEAEAVAHIACRRLDPDAVMPPYLAHYLSTTGEVPEGISLDRIMTAAGRVVEMAVRRVPPRKDRG